MDKYLPTLDARKRLVLDQIGETQKVIWRHMVEKHENAKRGAKDQVAADDFNINNLKKKVDSLLEVWEKLDAESKDSGSPPVEGTPVQSNAG